MHSASYQFFTELNHLKLELELSGVRAEVLYWGYFDGAEWWRNYLHVHSFFEICYVIKGKGVFKLDGVKFPLEQGHIFIARPDERHEIIACGEDPLGIFFWSYTLVPSNVQQNALLTNIFDAFASSSDVILENQSRHLQLLEMLCSEMQDKRAGYLLAVESLCKQLILETARVCVPQKYDYSSYRSNQRSHQDNVVNTVIRYLNDNYSEPLKLKEIAAQVYLSERHVSRIFKSVTGSSIKKFASQLRIDIAKQLLLNADKSISDVAYETGFQDVRYFSTVFKKHSGLSPSDFREKRGTVFIHS